MSNENKNIENKQEENRNKCEDKKSCWVKTQPTSLFLQPSSNRLFDKVVS